MIVVRAEDSKIVDCPNGGFRSHRMLLESDNMGFTVTKTVIPAGLKQNWHYKKHMEACYCISGSGTIQVVGSNKIDRIDVDTMYALNEHDNHIFTSFTEVVLICVFNPPLNGSETHKKDGSYHV